MPNELSVTCFIAAPPEKVWHAMTQRQEEWWCPRPWRTEIIEQDKRAGGRSADDHARPGWRGIAAGRHLSRLG
jgi:uncharacterized protein YndB with AHSA1/START domain